MAIAAVIRNPRVVPHPRSAVQRSQTARFRANRFECRSIRKTMLHPRSALLQAHR
ncbi:MAG: hypothetical protein ACOY6K_05275 [Pseudomonadota bacterium]